MKLKHCTYKSFVHKDITVFFFRIPGSHFVTFIQSYIWWVKFWLWIVITGWSFCLLLVFAHFTWKSLKVLSVNILNKSVYNIYFIMNQLYDAYDMQLITWIIWHYSCRMKHILVISISRLFDRQKERTQQAKISSQASRWNNDFIWFTSDQTSQWWPRNRSYL